MSLTENFIHVAQYLHVLASKRNVRSDGHQQIIILDEILIAELPVKIILCLFK